MTSIGPNLPLKLRQNYDFILTIRALRLDNTQKRRCDLTRYLSHHLLEKDDCRGKKNERNAS
jgi:hypothetical protein